VAHAERCPCNLLQFLGLEHLLHLQLLVVQRLPFLIAQDLIWVSACLLHCQDGHNQRVCRHHSYLREYMTFILCTAVLDMTVFTTGIQGDKWDVRISGVHFKSITWCYKSLYLPFWCSWIDWGTGSYTHSCHVSWFAFTLIPPPPPFPADWFSPQSALHYEPSTSWQMFLFGRH
jgi:hypothetical protein